MALRGYCLKHDRAQHSETAGEVDITKNQLKPAPHKLKNASTTQDLRSLNRGAWASAGCSASPVALL